MNKYLVLCCLVIVSACTDKKTALFNEIKSLEQSEKINTDEGLMDLAALQAKYGLKYKDSLGNLYLYSAGQFYFHQNEFEQSKELLYEYIHRDDTSKLFKDAALNLATIESNQNNHITASELVNEVLSDQLPSKMQWVAIEEVYKAKDSLTIADYENLVKAHIATGKFNDALKAIDKATTQNQDSEKRGDLLYRGGFIGWEYLEDAEIAEKYYSKFLSEYPNDEKAGEVKAILESGMLNMSDLEILEMLKRKQG